MRAFLVTNCPALNKRNKHRSLAAAAREADAARDDRKAARYRVTKKYAKETASFVARVTPVLEAPRTGKAVIKATPHLTKQQIRDKRKDWVNA